MVLDPQCCLALQHIVSDILSGSVSPAVRAMLVRTRLVGLGKPDGGVRPIAVGEALLKLAARVGFERVRGDAQRFFGNLQFGVLAAGGLETIVHNVHRETRLATPGMPLTRRSAKP